MNGEIAFYQDARPAPHRRSTPEPGFTVFSTMTCNGIRPTHDLGLVPDFRARAARVNHLAYRVDQRLDVERAAEVFMANDTPIEFGPGIHGIDEITYLYVREPGGLRIEINSGGWVNASRTGRRRSGTCRTRAPTTFWKQPPDAGLDDGVLAAARGRRAEAASPGRSTQLRRAIGHQARPRRRRRDRRAVHRDRAAAERRRGRRRREQPGVGRLRRRDHPAGQRAARAGRARARRGGPSRRGSRCSGTARSTADGATMLAPTSTSALSPGLPGRDERHHAARRCTRSSRTPCSAPAPTSAPA